MMTGCSLPQLFKILISYRKLTHIWLVLLPVLSVICPSHVSLPNDTLELLLVIVNLISKVSNPSVTLSQVTDTLALPSVASALIVIVNELELKSTPDPITVQ